MGNKVISVSGIGKRYNLKHLGNRHAEDLTINALKKWGRGIFKRKESIEEFWALRNITFDIEQGDRVGIIGRNGAGKSTLLKILSQIVSPTEGRIEYEGRMASLLEVGTGFHGDLSGRENIYLNGSILGMKKSEIDAKFDEIVAFSEVEQFLDTPVKRYSSGMYVRLAFAVAAHLESEILIVDEVLAVGDSSFQKKCLGKMNEISREGGRTILFVSHSMDAVQKLCNKGILLNKGQLIKSGEIDTVINEYIQSNIAGNGFFEIERNQLSVSNIPGKITSVEVLDKNQNPVNEIAIGSPWKLRIQFVLDRNIENFVAGFGLQSIHGIPITTTWSKNEPLNAGTYEIEFTNDDILYNSGIYKLSLGLSSDNVSFFYNDTEAYLTISDAGKTENDERMINKSGGIILNQLNYKISKK